MRLYVLPPSPRALKVIALKNHLGLECDMHIVDLGKGEHLTPEYVAMNPNRKMPVLEDDGYVLWESNAILFHLASKKPQSGAWPSDVRHQADVLRWLAWEGTHWDGESIGMVGFEKLSKAVLRLGPAEPAFIARGEQNFHRFATVLDDALRGRRWLTGDAVTIADFAIGAWVPAARLLELPIQDFPEVGRWYDGLASLPGWQESLVLR